MPRSQRALKLARKGLRRAFRRVRDLADSVAGIERPAQLNLPRDWQTHASQIAGRVVLITGSTRGIGRAAASLFASWGAIVAVHGRSLSGAQAVADELRAAGGRAYPYAADLGAPGSARQLVADVLAELGQLDVLINNGAVLPPHRRAPWHVADEEFARVLGTNLIAPFEASMAAVAWMEQSGRPGRIVNISTPSAETRDGVALGISAYGISKIALEGLTHYLAREAAAVGVSVIALRVPTTDTEMIAVHVDAERRATSFRAEQVAELYLWGAVAPASTLEGPVISG